MNLVFWNICHLLDLRECQLVLLIEQHQDYGLVAVRHEYVGFRGDKYRPDFDATVVKQPSEVTIGILLLVETFELDGDVFDFGRESASCLLLVGPVAVG